MRSEGRERRYLVTKRNDGLFEVYNVSWYKTKKLILKLELCYNCIEELSKKGFYFTPFSLKEYFKRNDTHIPETIRKIETVKEIQTYAPNQEDLSREYRKAANYKCQSCSVNCSTDTSLLHLHHLDGDTSNNKHDNLRVLCIDCHSKQPRHTHVAQSSKRKNQIETIKKLRNEQGITDLQLNL